MHDLVKKTFLQTLINRGSLKIDDVKTTLDAICTAYDETTPEDDASLKAFVAQIHKEISQYDQALTFYLHPIAGTEYLVFSVSVENNNCQEYSDLKLEDRQYFSQLIQHIAQKSDYSIDNMDVFNVLEAMPSSQSGGRTLASKQHMQHLVQQWIKQGYFFKTDNRLYFGPRMIVEFENSLKKTYPNNFQDCPLCHKITLWDITCSSCLMKIHRHCIRKYLAHKTDCPVCHKTWTTRLSID